MDTTWWIWGGMWNIINQIQSEALNLHSFHAYFFSLSPSEFIIDEDCILQLFKTCRKCMRLCTVRKQVKGLKLVVQQTCAFCQSCYKWTNLPDDDKSDIQIQGQDEAHEQGNSANSNTSWESVATMMNQEHVPLVLSLWCSGQGSWIRIILLPLESGCFYLEYSEAFTDLFLNVLTHIEDWTNLPCNLSFAVVHYQININTGK